MEPYDVRRRIGDVSRVGIGLGCGGEHEAEGQRLEFLKRLAGDGRAVIDLRTDGALVGRGSGVGQVAAAVEQGVGGPLLDRKELGILVVQPTGDDIAFEPDRLVAAGDDRVGDAAEDGRR